MKIESDVNDKSIIINKSTKMHADSSEITNSKKATPFPTRYLIEVGYEKVYAKSYRDHLRLVRQYEVSLHFKNKWRKSIERNLKNIRDFFTDWRTTFGIGFAGFYTYGLGTALLSGIIATGLVRRAIPISPATENRDGILFVPADGRKFYPRRGDADESDKSEVRLKIKADEFDRLIDDIADTYEGKPGDIEYGEEEEEEEEEEGEKGEGSDNSNPNPNLIPRVSPGFPPNPREGKKKIKNKKKAHGRAARRKTQDEVHYLMYEFSAETPHVETKIKGFLFSLPINVFVRHIYKIDKNAVQIEEIKKMVKDGPKEVNTLLFPRVGALKSKLIAAENLSARDEKIIEYGQTNVDIYNKNNKNVRYILDSILPFDLLKRLILPKSFRAPEYSPFKRV